MRRSHRGNPYIKIVAITAVILLAITRIPAWYENWLTSPTDPDGDQAVLFMIAQGENGQGVAHNLEEQGLISSNWLFYWYLKQNDLGDKIQAGSFPLSTSMSPQEIADAITSGHGELTLTIPEGWTIEQIDTKLLDLGSIENADDFKACTETCDVRDAFDFLSDAPSLEGYLFPDTYFINGEGENFSSEELIGRLLGTFESKFLTVENETAIAASGRTLEEIVIMASIVEREASSNEERTIIAGILWKRLDNGWGLEADATILYVLGDVPLTSETLATDSPYNTRLYNGLPPTAISNPGLASLEAALYPEESTYWFYLHDNEGTVHYAETLEGHNANKAQWL